jgi:nitroreductase
MNETIETILNRRSCRSFTKDPVGEEELGLILKAGLFAPSARNIQPWHISAVTDQQLLGRISDDCRRAMINSGDEGAATWAKKPDFSTFYGAPLVIIVSGDSANKFSNGDCANVTENMALAAHSLGLGSCYIASFRAAFAGDEDEALRLKLRIPEGYTPYFALSVGRRAADDAAPRRERTP